MTPDAAPPTWQAAWQAALDRLESDVARAEATQEVPTWQPPADLGPLPDSMRPRAEVILARQQLVMARLQRELGEAARQRAMVVSVGQACSPVRPALYVDVAM